MSSATIPVARSLGARIGRAWARPLAGRPGFGEDEPLLWLAYKAGVGRGARRWAAALLLDAVDASASGESDSAPIEGLDGVRGALADRRGGGAQGDEKEKGEGDDPVGDGPPSGRGGAGEGNGEPGAGSGGEEDDEEGDDPSDTGDTPVGEELDESPYQYRILLDLIRVIEETDDVGDDELQWNFTGVVALEGRLLHPDPGDQQGAPGHQHRQRPVGRYARPAAPRRLPPPDPQRRGPDRSAGAAFQFFKAEDFLFAHFFVTLFEVDSTDTMVEFFGLLLDFLEVGAGILNPIVGLSQLIQSGTGTANPQEVRDAAQKLKKIFDALVPDDLLGEKELIVTRGELGGGEL